MYLATHIIRFALAVVALSGFGSSASAQNPAVCPQDGPGSPLALHEEWIMEGGERRDGYPAFVFADKMGKYHELENPAASSGTTLLPTIRSSLLMPGSTAKIGRVCRMTLVRSSTA